MLSHVAVEDPAAPVLDDKEAVQQLERQCRHGEKIERDDRLAVILEKGQPPFPRVAAPPNASQIAGHTPFGDNETELQQFAMDFGRSPTGVLLRQAPDQPTHLLGDLRSAAARPGTPAPIEAETSAVPADDGLGLDDDEDVGPAGPTAAQGSPKESVEPVQDWPRPFAFKHGYLMTEGEDLQSGIAPSAKENAEGLRVFEKIIHYGSLRSMSRIIAMCMMASVVSGRRS